MAAFGRAGLLITLGLGLGLLATEIGLRFFIPFFPYQTDPYLSRKAWLFSDPGLPQFVAEHRLLWESDDFLRERVKPNINMVIHGNPEYPAWPVKTDSLGLGPVGFRDTLPDQPPSALVLGDSFGFGMGVRQEEIWSEILEQETGQPIVNLSQTGASSLQEARLYARYGRQLPVKLVFWLFFQNDLKDNLRFARWANPKAAIVEAVRQPDQTCTGPVHDFLEKYSLTYELLLFSNRACHYSNLPSNPVYRDFNLSLTFCLDHDICDLGVQTQMLAAGWPLTRQALLDTLVQLDLTGAELVIILVPSKEQVYWEQFRQVTSLPPDYNIDQLVEPVRLFCLEGKLHCLDLTPVFRAEAAKGQQLYFPVDIHWNAQGHALAAQVVEEFLRQEKLLP
jgi:hypothetical protein